MAIMSRKLLRINLSTRQATEEPIPEAVVKDFIGGRGFGDYYLYKELAPKIDPLGEKNKLMLAPGPLAGTSAQAVSRWMVCTKSPMTGTINKSACGADFGAWMRFAGYDLIIIEGKAERPVYIQLTKNTCQINPADQLWGKNTAETQDWMQEKHGDHTRVACIGQAGEKLVRYAAIVSRRRTAGRGGTGTVMGSKNLKAIAITAERDVHLADPDTFQQLVKEQIAQMQANKGYHHHTEMGTTTTHDVTNPMGIYPVKNFRYGQQENYQKLSGEEYRKFRIGHFGCYSCSSICGKQHRVISGPYAGTESSGPEYETIWAFSGPIDNSNIESTIAADKLCDDFGLDTISTGNNLGFAYELYEKGIITKKDTDGLELTYGNHAAMIELVKKIAKREGFGNILAEGVMRAAAKIGKGAENYAIHIKGLEPAGYEPRGSKSMGYSYATSNIGASHGYGYSLQEIFGTPFPRAVDRFAEEENADIVVFNQNSGAINEIGVACVFAGGWWVPGHYGKLLAAATGIPETANFPYLGKIGDRIVNLERAFNVREGFSRKDDTFPKRMLTEPLNTRGAPGDGQMIRNLDKFLDRYYQIRGWTPDGIPTPKKLEEAGLGFAANDMPS